MTYLYRAEREKQEKQRQEQSQGLSGTRGVRSSTSRREQEANRLNPVSRAPTDRAKILDRSPVTAFLQESNLCQYAEIFLQSGFDDLDILLEIEEVHMKDMGMPPGHVVKLKKCIRKLVGDTDPVRVPTQGKAAGLALVTSGSPEQMPRGMGSISQPSDNQMTAVQMSWVQLQQIGTDVAGGLFYKKFFQLQPEAKQLFPMRVRMRYQDWASEVQEDENDLDNSPALRKLWAKVIDAVGSAVAGLHDVNKLVPMLIQLGMRHVGYGLKPEYVQLAGTILVDVLKEGLGDAFTKEIENSWVMVFGFMSATMLQGFNTMQEEIKSHERKMSSSRALSDVASQHSGNGIVAKLELQAAQAAAEEEEALRRESENVIGPLRNLPSLLERLSQLQGEDSGDKVHWGQPLNHP